MKIRIKLSAAPIWLSLKLNAILKSIKENSVILHSNDPINTNSLLQEIHPLSPESGLMIDVYGNPIQI